MHTYLGNLAKIPTDERTKYPLPDCLQMEDARKHNWSDKTNIHIYAVETLK